MVLSVTPNPRLWRATRNRRARSPRGLRLSPGRILNPLALAWLSIVLAGCNPGPHQSDGVELVTGSASPTPAMTLELRFEAAMVQAGEIGLPAVDSPLVITPPVAGTFAWLSSRSGLFTPTAPLALDTRYELTLRRGLRRADGQPANAKLRCTLSTPPFGPVATWPRDADTNATSAPEIKLLFNADVRAAEAESFLYFRDAAGKRIPAEVRQGTTGEVNYELEVDGSLRTWLQEFAAANGSPSLDESGRAGDGTNQLANLLIATPRLPLPLGKNWQLIAGPGLPAADGSLHLRHSTKVPVGNVTRFVVTQVAATNLIYSGPAIRLEFSKPIPGSLTNEPGEWLGLTPRPTNVVVHISGNSLQLGGSFVGGQDYTLNLRSGFPSAEPFVLTGSNAFLVRVPHIAPRVYFPAFAPDQLASGRRTFPILTVNVPRVRVRARLLDPPNAIHALRGYASYFTPWYERHARDEHEWFRPLDYNLVPGRTVFDEFLKPAAAPDAVHALDLGWDRILRGRKTGVVFLDARQAQGDYDRDPAPGAQALIQLTDLGMIWKKAQTGVDVFVFSQRTGQPVSNATARLFSNDNESLCEAASDAGGCAHLAANADARWVAVQSGEDFHAVALDENRFWLRHGALSGVSFDPWENPRRVMLISDRDVYRPGEELHLAAIVRDWSDRGLRVPAGLTGELECTDARGRRFFRTNVAINASGSWSVAVPLPIASRGGYSAGLRLGDRGYHCNFEVQDFQPNAFEIALESRPAFAAGEKIQIPVSARYLFGQSLSRARIKWSLSAADTEFAPERFEHFSFGRTAFESRFGRGGSSLSLNGQGVFTGSSAFLIEPALPVNAAAPRPRAATLLAEVTDLNQQTLSRRVEFVRHSSDFYLGLRGGPAVLTPDKPLPLEVVAVGTDGQPWPETVKARLTLQRVDWETVSVQGAGRTLRYHHEAVFTNVFEETIHVAPIQLSAAPDDEIKGNRIAGLPALPAGQYLLELKAEDPGGRAVVSSMDFVVSAAAGLSWNYRNALQLALKPDRKSYAPGDTAEILVEAPFTGSALVTVEREKVLRSFVTRLEGNAPSIRVPLEPGDVPDVYVSVTLVRGAEDSPHRIREPEFRAGVCQLPVVDPQSRLALTVIPSATNCLPAQPVEAAVEVKDAAGRAVPGAEVLLYAVDDGILGLTGYPLPDPHAFFYAPRPLGVRSGISLANLLGEDPEELRFENKGFIGGGGGQKDGVRKNFLACAFWNAALSTDAQGRAVARFTAPDSLTRYRLFAVAHSPDSRFGSSSSAFHVSKPLTIDPALPAIANITDRLSARGIIHNLTARSGEVVVTLELDDKAAMPGSDCILTRRVHVPAHGSATVEFPVQFTDTGEAKWQWKARFADAGSGGFTDAVQSTIEVGHIAPLLREVLSSRVTASRTNLLAPANPRLLAGRGTITVTLANTRLNELGETASELLHYPYGCAEQTGSSLLPWIVLRDTTALPVLRFNTNDVNAAIRAGVARLFSMQTQSGGLGYWPRAAEPMPWASAYGGMVLALAQRHGVEVPKEEFDSLAKYLSQQLRSCGANASDLADACLALYALAVAGRAEPAYHEKFFALRQRLSAEDRALLALAIAESRGPAAMIGELLRTGSARQPRDEERFGCDARAAAIRLLAWTRYRPDDPVVDRLVEDLMREQKQGHWGTTQGNAWALLALTDYAKRVEGTLQPVEGLLQWGAQSFPFRLNDQTNLVARSFSFTNGADAALLLSNLSSHCLYASALIEARPPETPQPRQDRGFSLQRRYDRLDDDNGLQGLRELRVGDRVLVSLSLTVRAPASYVVIDDALPSILEAVNPEFQTQAARPAGASADDHWWLSDFREIRKDRCLSFANQVAPGNYTLRYLARVRAAGTVTAPPAKVEAMYHPERCSLSDSQVLASKPIE